MLLVDTGPLVAYLNRKDPDHQACVPLFTSRTDELLITPYVLTEACYLIAKYLGAEAEANLIEAVAAQDLVQVDVLTTDLARIAELARQYRSFPLGLADASVVAVAERLGLTEVATLDGRHFRAIKPRHCTALTLLP
jgi:predicted nucleic acid-binding protein